MDTASEILPLPDEFPHEQPSSRRQDVREPRPWFPSSAAVGAWLTLDGQLTAEPTTTELGGGSLSRFWTTAGVAYIHGFARPSATHGAISFEDGSTDNVEIVAQHFFYPVTPDHLEPGHRPTSFTILDASGHVLDQVDGSTLQAALSVPAGGGQLTTGTPLSP